MSETNPVDINDINSELSTDEMNEVKGGGKGSAGGTDKGGFTGGTDKGGLTGGTDKGGFGGGTDKTGVGGTTDRTGGSGGPG